MKRILFAAAFALTCAGGAAIAQEADTQTAAVAQPGAVEYRIIAEDARVAFGGSRVNSFSVGEDGSLLLRVGVNRWYRATVWPPCRNDLRWEHTIGIESQPGDTLDRFSRVIVDGQRCPLATFDEIEDPRIVEAAARAAAEAAAQTPTEAPAETPGA